MNDTDPSQPASISSPSSQPNEPESPPGHKRTPSGGILSKLSFLRASADENQTPADKVPLSPEFKPGEDRLSPKKVNRAMAVAVQQQKTRRRKGSLRKAALLGRGAQREKKEMKASPLEIGHIITNGDSSLSPPSPEETTHGVLGLGITNSTPQRSLGALTSQLDNRIITTLPMGITDNILSSPTSIVTSPTLTYTSTTDEDEILSIPRHNLPSRVPNSGPDSYFSGSGSLTRRRSAKQVKSPLSLGGLTANPLPVPDADWDYSETEWWGWVILIMTWIVFVTGMGSCLEVWSWAWDVGETPYAPPELEDDPTLPIVGYYPALIILTSVMAWVWVTIAWVGMKYFRHAKISGD